tara:strand:- start:303 stop:1619 length:1317 start_codon:yes stop_codon:yes gene_type:complete
MNNKNIIINFSLFIISLILINKIIGVFVSFDNYINFNALFINYEGGFLRRGLLGQVAMYLFKNFSINPVTFFSVVFSIANIIFFILFIKCIKKFRNNIFLYLVLLLSPATLMFSIFDSVNFFNNQIFLLISILLHCSLALKYFNEVKKYKKCFLLFILPFLFLNILQYDPQVLTLSIHILITYIVLSQDSQKCYKLLYYYIFLLAPILLIAFNVGSIEQINGERMKEIVTNTYSIILIDHPESFSMIDTNDLGGNLNLKIGAMIKIFGINFQYWNKLYFLLGIILSIIFFILIFSYFISKKIFFINVKNKTLIFGFIPLLSMFLFITDFGRTMHIILIHLLSIYFLFEINKDKEEIVIKKINFFKKILITLSIVIYCNVWTLNHAAGWHTIFDPKIPAYSKHSSYANEFKKIIFNTYYYTDKYIVNLPKGEFMKEYLK